MEGSILIKSSLLTILSTLQDIYHRLFIMMISIFDRDYSARRFVWFKISNWIYLILFYSWWKKWISNDEVRWILHVKFLYFVLFYFKYFPKTCISFYAIMIRTVLIFFILRLCWCSVISSNHIQYTKKSAITLL